MKETKKNPLGTAEKKQANRPALLLGAAAAAIVIVLAVVLGRSFFGEMTTPKKTVEGYLTSLYCDTKIRDMQTYLVEDIRETCYNDFTFYGQSIAILQEYQREKWEVVGEPFTLSVHIDNEASTSSTALKAAASAYGATQLRDVTFTVTFDGPDGTADFTGIARVAQIDGKWYLTEYNLPLSEN